VHVVRFGIDLSYYREVSAERSALLAEKWDVSGKGPIVGLVSKYVEYKGIQDVIPAFAELLVTHPNACLVLAGGEATPFQPQVEALLDKLPHGSYREVLFENDMPGLYSLFDIFLHVPRDALSEAFGQTYIEAMAAGVPSIFTLSGIAREIIRDGQNALVAPFRAPDRLLAHMKRLLAEPELGRRLADQAWADVQANFRLGDMIGKMMDIYLGEATV
jgi:glycosyltransferase involved in cell wall biosynthesis